MLEKTCFLVPFVLTLAACGAEPQKTSKTPGQDPNAVTVNATVNAGTLSLNISPGMGQNGCPIEPNQFVVATTPAPAVTLSAKYGGSPGDYTVSESGSVLTWEENGFSGVENCSNPSGLEINTVYTFDYSTLTGTLDDTLANHCNNTQQVCHYTLTGTVQ